MEQDETKTTLKRVGLGVLVIVAAVLLFTLGVQKSAEKQQTVEDEKSGMTEVCDNATVTKVIEETHDRHIGKEVYEETEYFFEVSFTDSNNKYQTAQTLEGDKEKRYAEGSKVKIMYNPKKPSGKCVIVRLPGFSTHQENTYTDGNDSSSSSYSSSSSSAENNSSSSSSGNTENNSSSSSNTNYHTMAQDYFNSHSNDENQSSDVLSDMINYNSQNGSASK